MKTLKLVGAVKYSSYAAGLKDPVAKGETAEFEDHIADQLLQRVYLDSANNAHPVWTEDLGAAPVHKPVAKEVSIQEAVKPPATKKAAPKKKGGVRKRTTAKK